MTHTTTPWKLTYFEIDDVQHLRGAEGQVIATIHSQVTGDDNEFEKQEEDRANDALLLAAPDLLSVLKTLLERGDLSLGDRKLVGNVVSRATS